MTTQNIKAEAHLLVDQLSDEATWEDLMYRIYVRQAIESGLRDVENGRTLDVKEVRSRLDLPQRGFTGQKPP